MPKQLTIGYLIDDSMDSTDGVQQYVRTVSEWMCEQGHTCHFLVGHSEEANQNDNIHSLSKVLKVPFNKNTVATPLPANRAHIKRLLSKQHFDVMHVQMPYSPFLAGRVLAELPDSTAAVGTFHILPFGRVNKIANQLLSRALQSTLPRLDEMVSVSPAAQSFAKEVYNIESEVISNTIDLRKFLTKRSLRTEEKPIRIVFLGRLVERKGAQQLLAALAALQTIHPTLTAKMECIIGGTGDKEKTLKQYATTNNLDHMVHFVGFVPEEEKPQLLNSADLAVFPALGGESFGIVLLEAMAAGASVVIGGDNPGYRSVLGGRPELLFNPRNAQEFAEKIYQMLSDTPLRDEIHRWQQREVRRYDIVQVGPKLLSCYQSAINKREGKAKP